MKIIIYKTKSSNRKQSFSWRMVRSNGRTVACAGEGFVTRRGARRAAEAVVHAIYTVAITYVNES